MATCLLCDDNFPERPETLKLIDYRYLYGFADGVAAALHGVGPKLCSEHQQHLDDALKARKVKSWGVLR